jgi:hypothetical protein
LDAMELDSGHKLNMLAVDGGMSNSNLCMQVGEASAFWSIWRTSSTDIPCRPRRILSASRSIDRQCVRQRHSARQSLPALQ